MDDTSTPTPPPGKIQDSLGRENFANFTFEGVEIQQYVDIYRISSDRSRLALYFVIIASLLVFTSNRNSIAMRDTSFGEVFYNHGEKAPFFAGDERLEHVAKEEYTRQFVSRVLMISSPVPGVWIAAEDVKIIAGVVLSVLMFITLLCLVREHENLYLAFYRVRTLCDEEGEKSCLGTSKANLLYHALAMTQVLRSPPTLARWNERDGRALAGLVSLSYFVPSAVFFYVFYTSDTDAFQSPSFAILLGREFVLMSFFLLVLLILGLFCMGYGRAIGKRWRKAFFRVNPNREYLPQMSYGTWLRLPFWLARPPWKWNMKLFPAATSEIVQMAEVLRPSRAGRGETNVSVSMPIEGSTIRREDVRAMTGLLVAQAEDKARAESIEKSLFSGLGKFSCETSQLTLAGNHSTWLVEGRWAYHLSSRQKSGNTEGASN